MHTMIRDFDEEYENAWMHLDIIIYNNVILAGLLQKDWSRFLGEEEARDGDDKIFHSVFKYVSKSTESTGAYWRGLSALACKKPLLAKRFFKLAVKTAPDDALKVSQHTISLSEALGNSSSLIRSTQIVFASGLLFPLPSGFVFG